MTKFLITPSLLNSFSYYIQDEWKSPADSRADFLKTLSREKFEPNEAMQKGIDFENSIQRYCVDEFEPTNRIIIHLDNGEEEEINEWDDYSTCVICCGRVVKDGLWQQTCKKDLEVGNKEFLLYGKMDVVKRDTIYDIKFTSNYELGKFSNSSQHLIYLYCTELPKFEYLVSDGENYWVESYLNHEGVENEIKSKISEFMGYLENDLEAKELFKTKWASK